MGQSLWVPTHRRPKGLALLLNSSPLATETKAEPLVMSLHLKKPNWHLAEDLPWFPSTLEGSTYIFLWKQTHLSECEHDFRFWPRSLNKHLCSQAYRSGDIHGLWWLPQIYDVTKDYTLTIHFVWRQGLSMYPRLASNMSLFSLSYLGPRIVGMCHNCWLS